MQNEIIIPIKVIKRGSAKSKVVSRNDRKINVPLRRSLAKAYKWGNDLMNVNADSYIARNKLSRRYTQRLLKLNCLSPKIKKAIMDGTFPQDIFLRDLILKEISLLWHEQEKQLLER